MGTVHAKSPAAPEGVVSSEVESTYILDVDDVKARVDRVHIEGVQRTKTDILETAVAPLFRVADIKQLLLTANEVREVLKELSCFKAVQIFIDVSKSTPHGVEVTYFVKENTRGAGGLNTQVGNNEGTFGVGFQAPNIFGRGEKLRLSYDYGTKRSASFFTEYTKPLVKYGCSKANASVFSSRMESPFSGYRLVSRGLSLGIDLYPLADVKHSVSWQGAWRDLNCLGTETPFSIREEAGHTLKSSVRYCVYKDTRDLAMMPSFGSFWRLSTEVSGLGGDVGFLQHGIDFQKNFGLFAGIVTQFGMSTSFLHQMPWQANMSLKTPLVCDRCFLGGPLNIRGFRMFGAGPHADSSSLGSGASLAYSAHLYSPMPGIRRTGGIGQYLRLHGFLTAGHVGDFEGKPGSLEELRDSLKRTLRASYGLGLVLRLGDMARCELNYCVPLVSQKGDCLQPGFQFGIGAEYL